MAGNMVAEEKQTLVSKKDLVKAWCVGLQQ